MFMFFWCAGLVIYTTGLVIASQAKRTWVSVLSSIGAAVGLASVMYSLWLNSQGLTS